VARLDSSIADLAREFVLLRVTNMRGIDLDLFDFDYDLTWAAFFMHPNGTVYGRYGGRDANAPENQVSLDGLKFAMELALVAHRKNTPARPAAPKKSPRTADQYRAAKRLKETSCIHCHQVYDFRREALQTAGKWRLEEVWVYPQPDNIGIRLDVNQGNRIIQVSKKSPADQIGMKRDDTLVKLNGTAIASLADVQYALHNAPEQGNVPVTWNHRQQMNHDFLKVASGWRKTDISWRWSLRGLDPQPDVHGEDLGPGDKKALGLSEKSLAFRQGNFVSATARQAGLRQNDVILGVDHKSLMMSAREFDVFMRLNYRVGDRVILNVLRDGQRVDLPMTLAARNPF
jgi:hypothetical protein